MLSALRTSRVGQAMLGPPQRSGEAEPLLSGQAGGKPKRTPLPVKQLFILCMMRTAEPIAFTVIFPFIANMIEHLGITDNPEKVGYYAGLVESAFAFSTFLSVVAWGRISDRIGRKPVLLIGLSGVTLSLLAFGTAQSLLGLVVARFLGGALNGNVAVLKSMVGELSDESNQGLAFTCLPLSWSLGSIIGPLLGGYLAEPATRYGGVFDNALFRAYPFLLPCLAGASAPFLTGIVGGYFLEETLKKPEKVSAAVAEPTSSATSDSGTVVDLEATTAPKAPGFTALFTRDVNAVLGVYMLLALQTVALDAVFVLFCYTSVQHGGLSFSEADIGRALSFGGASTVFFQVLVFPRVQARFGTIRLYRATLSLYVPVFLLLPLCAWVAAHSGTDRTGVWAVMGVYIVIKSMANCAYACNMLAVTSCAPSQAQLGLLNGVAQMGSSLMRTIGPFSASSLFAFSLEKRGAPTILMFGLAVFAVGSTAASFLLNPEVAGWRKTAAEADGQRREDEE